MCETARHTLLAGVFFTLTCSPLQAADFVPGELIVTYEGNSVSAVRSSLPAGTKISPLTPETARIVLPPGEDALQMQRRLATDPRIRHVQPNYIKRIQLLPDDPSFAYQWAMENTGQEVPSSGGALVHGTAGADVSAAPAWDVTTGSSDVVVALIDTGVSLGHPDLAPNLWTNPLEAPGNGVDDDGNGYVDDVNGWDWTGNDATPADGNGHGTYVAGIIAARGNNGRQIAGLNWQASLMVLRTFDQQGISRTSDIVQAVHYAVDNGARVINASYGSVGGAQPGAPAFDRDEYEAYRYAQRHGVLVVASACNQGVNNDGIRACVPASYDLPNILSVAASDMNDRLAGFSNWGAISVDLAAPGVAIATTPWHGKVSDTIAVVDGTSIASSFVSGAAALLLARADALGLSLSVDRLRSLLVDHVDVLPDSLGGRVASGGRLNVAAALTALDALASTQQVDAPSTSPTPSPPQAPVPASPAGSGGGGGALDPGALLLGLLLGWCGRSSRRAKSGRKIHRCPTKGCMHPLATP